VIVEKMALSPWQRWLHGDTFQELLKLPALTILALSTVVAPSLVQDSEDRADERLKSASDPQVTPTRNYPPLPGLTWTLSN
jgi:hypothetical protein